MWHMLESVITANGSADLMIIDRVFSVSSKTHLLLEGM